MSVQDVPVPDFLGNALQRHGAQQGNAQFVRRSTSGDPALDFRLRQVLQELGRTSDPVIADVKRALAEEDIRETFDLPRTWRLMTPQEYEAEAAKQQHATMQLLAETSKMKVNMAFGAMMDQADALGIDETIGGDPDRFIEAAAKLQIPLSKQDLAFAGLIKPTTPGAEVSELASQLTAQEKVYEKFGEALNEGGGFNEESPLGKRIADILRAEASREESKPDLVGTADPDYDDDPGSQAFFRATRRIINEVGAELTDKGAAVDLLLAGRGKGSAGIAGQLEGLRSSDGYLDVMDSDMGITEVANFYLNASLMLASDVKKQTMAETYAQIGSEYIGVDPFTFYQAATREAGQFGMDTRNWLASVGLLAPFRREVQLTMRNVKPGSNTEALMKKLLRDLSAPTSGAEDGG